ncbi:MAG: aldehyde ferredoxin oxidoreductase family protein, partial [Actinobacteria bacterium]|nr:aldehyde ferredoxin oxidoreductase family protein [Actinomycetota bacterium]
MFGWTGKILKVDLTNRGISREEIPEDILFAYLGGRGLGVRLMRDYFHLDPLTPEMPLIFAVGPLCGTTSPTSARMSVISRSPLTNTIYDSSCGGLFAHRLKGAGLDAIMITGRSDKPVYIQVTEESEEIQDASLLWGKDTLDTMSSLMDKGSVAAIGPAGERGVLFANIMVNASNSVGRGGIGAVMGAKNLKAIVVSGSKKTEIADKDNFKKGQADVMRLFKASPIIFGELGMREFGTPALVDLIKQRRMVPTENFRKTFFEEANNYSGPSLRKLYKAKKEGCFGCPIQCKKVDSCGRALPEYETASHFGALNKNSDIHSIVKSNELCNLLGLDTISMAATIAAYGEAKGRFFTPGEIIDLIHKTGSREGEGEKLALGSARLCEMLGVPHISMSVKGLELPAYDPRGAYGMALAYVTSGRGGCHLRAYPIANEILRKPVATDRFSFSGKARIIKIAEDTNAVADSLEVCKFAILAASLEEYAQVLQGVTGMGFSGQSLLKIGERIVITERFYNCENGFSAKDDTLPERFFNEPGTSGEGIEVKPIDKARFIQELQKYYKMRGLNKNGCFN